MTPDEEQEEEFEVRTLEKEYSLKYCKENMEIIRKGNKAQEPRTKRITEEENILNCLITDLQLKYFTLFIKTEGEEINTSNVESSKISKRTLKKLDVIQASNAQEVKRNMEHLNHSLQEAGKLEPDKPTLTKKEKEMLHNISDNTYLISLFYSVLAANSGNKQDQKYLINKSAGFLLKCFELEEKKSEYYEKYFFFVKSVESYNKNSNIDSRTNYPYNLLSKTILIESTDKLPEPILINKTSTTATLLCPIVKIKNNHLDKTPKVISRVKMHCQQSTGTNIVQINNSRSTNGTSSVFDLITIRNLKPNNRYIFAYCGYDTEDVPINTIGETSKEVEAYFPLPLWHLSYRIAKTAYELNQHGLCRDISKKVFSSFTERTEIKSHHIDLKANCLLFYRLKLDYILNTSLLELEGVAFCFLFFARCMLILKPNEHNDGKLPGSIGNPSNLPSRQKNILKNINVLTLALEIAVHLRNFALIKTLVVDIYNSSVSLLQQTSPFKEMTQTLIKMHFALNMIPNELSDVNLRKTSALVSYQILKHMVSINEIDLCKKFLLVELGVKKKKYYLFNYKYMKREELGKNKPAKDEEAKYIEADGLLVKDLEKEPMEIDEYIFSLEDFNEILKNKLLSYLTYLPDVKDLEVERRKKEMMEFIEVWDGFKNENLKFFYKFISANKDTNEKYYEYTSKLLKKSIENFQLGKKEFAIGDLSKLSEDIIIKEQDIIQFKEIWTQKINFVTNDVIYSMKLRIKDLLDQVEKELDSSENKHPEIDVGKIRTKIEEKYFGAEIEEEKVVKYFDKDSLIQKERFFWLGDLLFNKIIIDYINYVQAHKPLFNCDFNNFLNFKIVSNLNPIIQGEYNIRNFDNFYESVEKNESSRRSRMKGLMEKISLNALFLLEAKSFKQFDNLVYLTYNLILFDMLSPNEADEVLGYLNIISDCATKRLEVIHLGESDYTEMDYNSQLVLIQSELNSQGEPGKTYPLPRNNTREVNKIDEELVVDVYKERINFEVYVELICFTIQATYNMRKWNVLANMITKFNHSTREHFKDFTFEYLTEAQRHLHESALENVKNKQTEINHRVSVYETWKNSRKKNKRQQLITGEIPQEQLDYERDHTILSKELFILESISKMLQEDRAKISAEVVSDAVKAVKNCRRSFTMLSLNHIQSRSLSYRKAVSISSLNQNKKLLISLQMVVLTTTSPVFKY